MSSWLLGESFVFPQYRFTMVLACKTSSETAPYIKKRRGVVFSAHVESSRSVSRQHGPLSEKSSQRWYHRK